MNQNHHPRCPGLAYNKDYFAFPYDSIFTSKLLNLPWKDSVEQESFSDHNYDCVSVWPPRHYSCNFCDRDFRSAQALGGHMNVHRRDRARLRQGLVQPDLNEDHTNLDASTLQRSDSSAINSLKRSSLPPRVCTLLPNQSVVNEDYGGFLMKDQTEDDIAIISVKRRRLNPLIEPQHEDVDLELRL